VFSLYNHLPHKESGREPSVVVVIAVDSNLVVVVVVVVVCAVDILL
jgi:hypothetical protein